MISPSIFQLCLVYSLLLLALHSSHAYVSVDDCEESGPHQYHAHTKSSHSSAYTSGYTQSHPSPSGRSATSSSYIRTGNAVNGHLSSGNTVNRHLSNQGYEGVNQGYDEGDLQVASSYSSPTVSSAYHSAGSGGYGLHRSSSNYGSTYGATSGKLVAQESHVRQKFEDLKQKADQFVKTDNAPPPVGSFSGVPLASHVGSSSQSSQYQQTASRYGTGNILGVTYGTTGTEDDDSQRLVPVPATLPAASALTAASRKESHDAAISYSTSGVVSGSQSGDGVDFSISQSVPLGVPQPSEGHVSRQFEELKQKADAFVHEGAPPPSSSASHLTSDLSQSSDLSQTSQSTHVQTLPVQATSHGTYVVPVRVTVTREQTLPGGQEVYYEQTPSGSVVKHTTVKESFSSRTSSGAVQPSYVRTVEGSSLQGSSGGYVASQHAATGNTGYVTSDHTSTNTASSGDIGSSSSYSYNKQGDRLPPQVYTVGPQGSVQYPESQSYQKPGVRENKVIVPGAVAIVDTEEAVRKSNKLFDLVSGYGTFLPAKEEVGGVTENSSSSYSERRESSSQSGTNGYVSGISGVSSGYNSEGSGNSGYSGSSGVNTGYASGTGVNGGYNSGTSSTGYVSRTSGVNTGGYSGVIPAGGTVRKTATGYTYYAKQPLQVSPDIPVGDPLSPPEVSGSYFGSRGYAANYGLRSENSAVREGYGSGGFRNENLAFTGGYGNSEYGRNSASRVNEGYSGSYGAQDSRYGAQDSRYGVKGANYGVTSATYGSTGANYGARNDNYGAVGSAYGTGSAYGARDTLVDANCGLTAGLCDTNLIATGGGVKKYGISSSWSSKSQTVNGKTTQSKEAVVTVNDNGKVDTYATHSK